MLGKLFGRIAGGNVLYYPGCLTHFALPEIEENYIKILKRMGIDAIVLPEFNCCGSPVKHAGYARDFENLKIKNAEIFRKYGIKKIITNCPACFLTLKNSGFNAEHITQTLSAKMHKLKAGSDKGKIAYHDPCHLGRHSGIYDEPRNILKHIGYEVIELASSRENSLCCGAGAGMKANHPETANKAAKICLGQCSAEKLVSTCPLCYMHFKENAPKGIEVLEFSEVLQKELK